MKIGIDVIDLATFKEAMDNGGESFINQHFLPGELLDKSYKHLAGVFSVKEAIFKTGFLQKLDFLSIQIINSPKGKPAVYDLNGNAISDLEISITHSDSLAMSVAIWAQGNIKS